MSEIEKMQAEINALMKKYDILALQNDPPLNITKFEEELEAFFPKLRFRDSNKNLMNSVSQSQSASQRTFDAH